MEESHSSGPKHAVTSLSSRQGPLRLEKLSKTIRKRGDGTCHVLRNEGPRPDTWEAGLGHRLQKAWPTYSGPDSTLKLKPLLVTTSTSYSCTFSPPTALLVPRPPPRNPRPATNRATAARTERPRFSPPRRGSWCSPRPSCRRSPPRRRGRHLPKLLSLLSPAAPGLGLSCRPRFRRPALNGTCARAGLPAQTAFLAGEEPCMSSVASFTAPGIQLALNK